MKFSDKKIIIACVLLVIVILVAWKLTAKSNTSQNNEQTQQTNTESTNKTPETQKTPTSKTVSPNTQVTNTPGIKLYRNESHGLEFQYPSTYIIKESVEKVFGLTTLPVISISKIVGGVESQICKIVIGDKHVLSLELGAPVDSLTDYQRIVNKDKTTNLFIIKRINNINMGYKDTSTTGVAIPSYLVLNGDKAYGFNFSSIEGSYTIMNSVKIF